jgi:hypothetical protein
MDAIHNHLIRKSDATRLIYTAELIPERQSTGQMLVMFFWFVQIGSDKFTMFPALGGDHQNKTTWFASWVDHSCLAQQRRVHWFIQSPYPHFHQSSPKQADATGRQEWN